ncbi:hypothetical protein EYQ95_25905, partial [Lysobacter sp. N42]
MADAGRRIHRTDVAFGRVGCHDGLQGRHGAVRDEHFGRNAVGGFRRGRRTGFLDDVGRARGRGHCLARGHCRRVLGRRGCRRFDARCLRFRRRTGVDRIGGSGGRDDGGFGLAGRLGRLRHRTGHGLRILRSGRHVRLGGRGRGADSVFRLRRLRRRRRRGCCRSLTAIAYWRGLGRRQAGFGGAARRLTTCCSGNDRRPRRRGHHRGRRRCRLHRRDVVELELRLWPRAVLRRGHGLVVALAALVGVVGAQVLGIECVHALGAVATAAASATASTPAATRVLRLARIGRIELFQRGLRCVDRHGGSSDRLDGIHRGAYLGRGARRGGRGALQRLVTAGRLHFTTDAAAAIAHGDVIFIAVG